nr:MAG TPA: hypothetical protein [Caudoviricetes sp.]
MSLAEKCYMGVTMCCAISVTINITLLLAKIEKTRARSRELRRVKKFRDSERVRTRSHLRDQNKQLTMLYYDIIGGKYND